MFWIKGILLGVVIGMHFKYFIRSKKLSLLTAYMLLMFATIGRVGSQYYFSATINRSTALIIWIYMNQENNNREEDKELLNYGSVVAQGFSMGGACS